MLGIIINGVVDFVRHKRGRDGIKELEKAVDMELQFMDLKNYSEEEFLKVAVEAMRITGYDDIVKFQKALAPTICKTLLSRYPDIPKKYEDFYSFMMNLPSLHRFMPTMQAGEKKIAVISHNGKNLVIEYNSPNKLDHLLIQFVEEAAKYYGEKINIKEISMMSEGAEKTAIDIQIL